MLIEKMIYYCEKCFEKGGNHNAAKALTCLKMIRDPFISPEESMPWHFAQRASYECYDCDRESPSLSNFLKEFYWNF